MLLNQKQVKQMRFILRNHFNGIHASHITEALSYALGHRTNASFIAMDYKVLFYSKERFYNKLSELSGQNIQCVNDYDIVDFAYFSVSKDYEKVCLSYLSSQEIMEYFVMIYHRIKPNEKSESMWRDRMFVMVGSSVGVFKYLENTFSIADLDSLLSYERLMYLYNDYKDEEKPSEEMKTFKLYIESLPFSNRDNISYKQHMYLKMMIDVCFMEFSHLLGKYIFENHIIPKVL